MNREVKNPGNQSMFYRTFKNARCENMYIFKKPSDMYCHTFFAPLFKTRLCDSGDGFPGLSMCVRPKRQLQGGFRDEKC